MSEQQSNNTPPIFSKLNPKTQGFLTKVNQAISKDSQSDNMSNEQTCVKSEAMGMSKGANSCLASSLSSLMASRYDSAADR